MPVSPLTILKEYWGHHAFRPQQEAIIQSVLAGRDTLALLPTGGGKSACYQVPALVTGRLCLVVSPLIALMKDQVAFLQKKGITAFAIYSGMKRQEVMNILKLAGNSNCRFLYVSPERLETKLFLEYLPAMGVGLVAVDEAHCISQWGYDFRPPYLRIAALREELPGVPVLALTASATPEVQKDICEKLLFTRPAVFRQSFARPNLSYSVFATGAKMNKLIEVLNNVPGSSIVYCRSRSATKEIAGQLCSYGVAADHYHAGLPTEERNSKQEDWIKNKTRVIVCTNAFGMGIDKADVSTVVHLDLPDCLEHYYQEAGRAGRNGKKAYAVLIYEADEPGTLQQQVALRFPGIETLRSVYQAIANYLQLPAGSGAGMYFDFDITDFTKKFSLPGQTVLNVLKVLEQEGWLGFNEQVFLPAKLQFVCKHDRLRQFEQERPDLEPLVTLILRSYEGAFDRDVAIFEKQLAGWLKTTVEAIRRGLLELHRYHIIRYQPQKDRPQLFMLQSRVKVEDLSVDEENYRTRKRCLEQRIAAFLQYIGNTADCRAQQVAAYFGDDEVPACGICDNCLNRKKLTVSKDEFSFIQHRIESAVGHAPVNPDQLLQQLAGIRKEKAWQVIEFLQAEGKIAVDGEGRICKCDNLKI